MQITGNDILLFNQPLFQCIWITSYEQALINRKRPFRVYSLMYIGDFVSYYLAILNNIDPAPVETIDYLKKELAKI